MCEFCNIKAKPNCIYILLLSSILRHTIEGVVSKFRNRDKFSTQHTNCN